jgi:hypothetical protein
MTQTRRNLLCVMIAARGDNGSPAGIVITHTSKQKGSTVDAALHSAHDGFFAEWAKVHIHHRNVL